MSRPTGEGFPSYLGPKKTSNGGPTVVATGLWAVMLLVGFIVICGLIRAFVITKLWEWFIIPTFASAPDLTLAAAWGISMLVGFLTYQASKTKEGIEFWGALVILPLSTLLVGWIVQFWM
jgi:hypothetical protein